MVVILDFKNPQSVAYVAGTWLMIGSKWEQWARAKMCAGAYMQWKEKSTCALSLLVCLLCRLH